MERGNWRAAVGLGSICWFSPMVSHAAVPSLHALPQCPPVPPSCAVHCTFVSSAAALKLREVIASLWRLPDRPRVGLAGWLSGVRASCWPSSSWVVPLPHKELVDWPRRSPPAPPSQPRLLAALLPSHTQLLLPIHLQLLPPHTPLTQPSMLQLAAPPPLNPSLHTALENPQAVPPLIRPPHQPLPAAIHPIQPSHHPAPAALPPASLGSLGSPPPSQS